MSCLRVAGVTRLDVAAQVRIGRGEAEVVDDGAPVEARPSHEQGRGATRVHERDGVAREVAEVDDGQLLRRIEDIEQVVRDAGTHRGVRLRRADVHPAIDGERVDGDDLGGKSGSDARFSDADRERGLPRRRRSEQGEHASGRHLLSRRRGGAVWSD